MNRAYNRAYLKRPDPVPAPLPPERSLAVLIVTHDSHDRLEQCLASVAEQLPEHEVYLLPTYQTGRPELMSRYPAVRWVLDQPGLGSAEALNALVQCTPSNADLLLVHPNARLTGPLSRTLELLRQPGVAAVSPMPCADRTFGPPPWNTATRRLTLTRALVGAGSSFDSLRGTPWLAINRAAWNTVGGFDEEFFGYGEKTDWLARARAGGWRVLLADERVVDHGNPAAGPHGCEPTAAHSAQVLAAERRRDHDLLRANTALLIEHQNTVHHADAYLAGIALAKRLSRSKRAGRGNTATRRNGLPTIVIATNRLVYGGAERQKALLATELDRRGYPVTIVCVQRFGPLVKEIPPSVRVVRQPWWAPIVDIPPGPAVLISGDTNTETGFATLWRAAGSNRRWLVAAHIPPEEHRPIYSRPLAAAMRRADGFIVLAQRHWDMLTAHHRLGGRRFVAPNGVAVTDAAQPRIRAADEPLNLVMLSRIVEHKNPHLLLEALSGLADVPWTLSIFGDGPDRERLQADTPIEVRDRVRWRGWSAGPGPALAEADLLCVPSRSEAFPLAILEAMARAIPVAASAICAVPEMLDFGRAGFVVAPVTVAGWRQQLAQILANPSALPSTGQCGFERMRTHYTIEAMTDAYLEAINAVL